MVAAVSLQSSTKRKPWNDHYPAKPYAMARPATAGAPSFDLFASKTLDFFSNDDTDARCSPAIHRQNHPDVHLRDDSFDFQLETPLPPGWEKCLDLKTGKMYYLNRASGAKTTSNPRNYKMRTVGSTLVNNNWTASPSTSDLTAEANKAVKGPKMLSELSKSTRQIPKETDTMNNLDLTLSLRPSKQVNGNDNQHQQSQHQERHQRDGYHYTVDGILAFVDADRSSDFRNPGKALTTPSNHHRMNPTSVKDMDVTHLFDRATKVPRPSIDLRSLVNNKQPLSDYCIKEIDDTAGCDDTSMITVGCSNCLMYVMLPKKSMLKCPKCGAFLNSCDAAEPAPKKARVELSLMR